MNLGWAAILIASSLVFVPRLGGLGLAASYLVSYLAHTVWVMAYVEFSLPRCLISKQWQLVTVFTPSAYGKRRARWGHFKQFVFHMLLIAISLLPLINLVRSKLLGITGQTGA